MHEPMYFDTFGALINQLNSLAQNGNYVFRGYSKESELLPQIIRIEGKEISYTTQESDCLEKFEQYGSSYYNVVSAVDFLSCAQHYGLPTRLLDFTYNPYIALFFALYNPKRSSKTEADPNYHIIYANLRDNITIKTLTLATNSNLNSPQLTNSMAASANKIIEILEGRNIEGLSIKELGTELESQNKSKILFLTPVNSNVRIIMQQGLFMLPYTLNKRSHLEIIRSNTTEIVIAKKLRNQLLNFLDTLGFNTYGLMPDINSVCRQITKELNDNTRKINKDVKEGKNTNQSYIFKDLR